MVEQDDVNDQKMKIIGLAGCDACELLKETLKNKAEFINLDDIPDAVSFLKENNIHENEEGKYQVPILIDERGQVCEFTIEDGRVVAQCGDETRIIDTEDIDLREN